MATSSLSDCRRIVKDLREDFEAAERIEAAIRAVESSSFREFEAVDAAQAAQLEKDLARFEIHPVVDGLEIRFDFDDAVEAIRNRFDPLDVMVLTDGRGRFAARIVFGCGGPFYGVEKDAFSCLWKFFCCWGGESYEETDVDGLIEGRFMDIVREQARYITSGGFSY